MLHYTALIVIGTATAMLATILLLLRAKIKGRRVALALTRQWLALSTWNSGLVLALLATITVACVALLATQVPATIEIASTLSGPVNNPAVTGGRLELIDDKNTPQDVESLRNYAQSLSGNSQPTTQVASGSNPAELPTVDTMIAKLVARLQEQPDDVKGWKMLGWSYLNTDRPVEAVNAYETALKLAPADTEAKNALEAANSALKGSNRMSVAPASPTSEDIAAAQDLSESERNSMIRGMVDQLAARLDSAPNDEEGWVRLMRSRMILGEPDAAKAALAKALRTFASNAAVTNRLNSAARELGVASN